MKGIKKVVALFAALVFAFSIFGCSADSTSGENSVENPKQKDDESKETEQTDAQKEATGTYTIGKTTYTVEEGKVRVKAEDGTTKEVGTVSKDGVITITEEGKTTTITATKIDDGETTRTTVQVTTKTAEGTEETKTYEGDLSTGTLTNKDDPEDSLTVSKTEKSDEEEPEKPGEEPQNPETPTVKNFTVTFVTNCDAEIESQTIKEGEKASQPTEELSKTGYEFGGWYLVTGESVADDAFDFDTAITGAITLKAKWNIVTYKIIYGNVLNATNPNTVTTYTVEDEIILENASKTGFTFDGWFDALTDGNKVEKIEKGSTGAKTFYARWTVIPPNKYSVKFDTDGGSAVSEQTVTEGEKTKKPSDPAKTGYEFKGWYLDGNPFSFETAITGAVTLKAQWSLVEYNITYAGADGATNPNATTKYTIESEDIILSDADKKGYEFKGWSNGAAVVTKIAKGTTGAITLTATWKALEYSISYAGVSGATNQNATTYTIEDEITLVNASKEGFTFDGWFDAAEGGNAVTKIAKGSSGEKTLYARWTNASGFTVTIEPNARISVEKTINDENGNVTLTAADGFTNYAWLIDDFDASSLEGAKLSEDGKTLILTSAGFRAGSVYQIVLTAKKGSTIYGAQITVKKQSGMNS